MINFVEKKILNEFLNTRIPNDFKMQDVYDKRKILVNTGSSETIIDAMYCYEEIFDYSHSLLKNINIKKNSNFCDTEAIIFHFDFVKYLNDMCDNYPTTKEICLSILKAFKVICDNIN